MDKVAGKYWWLSDEEKEELFWKNTRDHWTSEDDKKRIFQNHLQQQRLDAQALREAEKHKKSLEKLRHTHNLKTQEKTALQELDRETAIALRLLDQGLLPEKLDIEFNDLIRRSDIELQTLQAELHIRDEIDQREHDRNIDKIYQVSMMETFQETARLLDEQNKTIAINQQETQSKALLERQQHQQTLERERQEHAQGMQRDSLQSQLKREEFTHEELTRLAVRVLAKNLGLSEGEISEDQVNEWVRGFEDRV